MNDEIFKNLLKEVKWLDADIFGKDFLLTWDFSINELSQILYVAEALKYLRDSNISTRCFDSGQAVTQFRDKSTDTRFSFASAANMLGLTIQDIDDSKSWTTHQESFRETVHMISSLTDIFGICDTMNLGSGTAYMRKVAEVLDEGIEKRVLPQRPGIVNLQCDIDQPTRTMADLLHLKHHFGSLERLEGKKMTVQWVYSPGFDKSRSMAQGIIALMTRFGMEVTLAHPKGYDLLPEVIDIAWKNASERGKKFKIAYSMDESLIEADIVYALNWDPSPVIEKRTTLLKNNDQKDLQKLEQACIQQNAKHKNWESREEKKKITKKGEILYMPYIIASIMLNNRFRNPGKVLETLKKREIKRTIY